MSTEAAPVTTATRPGDAEQGHSSAGDVRQRRRRARGGGHSILAQGEPIVWLNAAGLVICGSMILGLLLLVLYQGITTFWPIPVVQGATVAGDVYMGEVTRHDRFELNYGSLAAMSGPTEEAAAALLNPRFRERIRRMLDGGRLSRQLASQRELISDAIVNAVTLAPAVRGAASQDRDAILQDLRQRLSGRNEQVSADLSEQLAEAVNADKTGARLYSLWNEARAATEEWVAQPELAAMRDALKTSSSLLGSLWLHHTLSMLSNDVAIPMNRRLVRTGNFEITNEHFRWVSDFESAPASESQPEWALVFERLAWGRFYGFPKALKVEGQTETTEPAEIWSAFRKHHPEVRARWAERRKLETVDTGEVNRLLEEARLELRRIELKYGEDSPEWISGNKEFQEKRKKLDQEFARLRSDIRTLDELNDRYQLVVETVQGQEKSLALADIVRVYPANQQTWFSKLGIYLSRWWEFLSDDPREANSEGGVLPAIWGTVAMTVLMSVAVVPFGVLAALYLREYAKAGFLVSTVRIAVNNLAGVPSIVFGVFGLGFFCYIIGASVDEMFFAAKLPNPTFGTGGLMWAAFTLALLTLPVVIVATEEALSAVPRSMREGSLACGATKWQTIRRIVLPRAMPGIMTGMILAMARGAGEVAPLMLVGAVKLAPELPVDGIFPYIHLERSFMHLGFHIYDLGFQSQNSEAAKPMVFTTTLLLITIVALMNVLAIWLRARLRRKFEFNQF